MSILDFFGLSGRPESADAPEVESIRKIARRLEEMEPDRARHIAAFAYLLGRVAHADLDISRRESAEMERIVREKGHLPTEQAVMTVEIAKRQNRLFGHVENFLVAREFKELATREQKMELLDCLFAVSAADGSISTREDGEIRQIAAELLLERPDFIEVRSRYRDFLDVLRMPEGNESE